MLVPRNAEGARLGPFLKRSFHNLMRLVSQQLETSHQLQPEVLPQFMHL